MGAFLSGGVDSSYITAAQMPDETFSVGFDYHKFDETDYARELSDLLKIKNYKKMLTADECFAAFPEIQYHMDEPQSNPSCVPLYFLAKLASEHVTVVLSGEGADEIFAGYETYDISGLSRKYRKIPKFLRSAAAKCAAKLPYFKGHDFIIKNGEQPEDYYFGQACIFTDREAMDCLLYTSIISGFGVLGVVFGCFAHNILDHAVPAAARGALSAPLGGLVAAFRAYINGFKSFHFVNPF